MTAPTQPDHVCKSPEGGQEASALAPDRGTDGWLRTGTQHCPVLFRQLIHAGLLQALRDF